MGNRFSEAMRIMPTPPVCHKAPPHPAPTPYCSEQVIIGRSVKCILSYNGFNPAPGLRGSNIVMMNQTGPTNWAGRVEMTPSMAGVMRFNVACTPFRYNWSFQYPDSGFPFSAWLLRDPNTPTPAGLFRKVWEITAPDPVAPATNPLEQPTANLYGMGNV